MEFPAGVVGVAVAAEEGGSEWCGVKGREKEEEDHCWRHMRALGLISPS